MAKAEVIRLGFDQGRQFFFRALFVSLPQIERVLQPRQFDVDTNLFLKFIVGTDGPFDVLRANQESGAFEVVVRFLRVFPDQLTVQLRAFLMSAAGLVKLCQKRGVHLRRTGSVGFFQLVDGLLRITGSKLQAAEFKPGGVHFKGRVAVRYA